MRNKTIPTIAAAVLAIMTIAFSGGAECANNEDRGVETVPTTLGDLSSSPMPSDTDDNTGEYLGYENDKFPEQSVFGVLARLVLSMVAIVALIYGTVSVLRHFAKRGTVRPENERLVQVIDRTSLDAKRSIYIVKVIDRLMILGVGGENVSVLGEIKDESVVESVRSNDFSFHLRNIFSRVH